MQESARRRADALDPQGEASLVSDDLGLKKPWCGVKQVNSLALGVDSAEELVEIE